MGKDGANARPFIGTIVRTIRVVIMANDMSDAQSGPFCFVIRGRTPCQCVQGVGASDLKQTPSDGLRRRRSAIIAGAEHAEPALARRGSFPRTRNSVQRDRKEGRAFICRKPKGAP